MRRTPIRWTVWLAPVGVVLVWAALGASCAEGGAAPLHLQGSFHGRVRVAPPNGAAFEGELTFDRAAGNFQVTLRSSEETVAISELRAADGSLDYRVFRNGEPSGEVEARYRELMGWCASIVRAPEDAGVERTAGGYRVTVAGEDGVAAVRIGVEVVEVFGSGAHGWR